MASNGKFISIKAVANRLLQNPLMKELTWEFIVSNAVECMRIAGTPVMYVDAKEELELKNYKAQLPVNIMSPEEMSVFKLQGGQLIPMIEGLDTMITHYKEYPNLAKGGDLTPKYKLNANFIFTNFKEGKLVLTYKTIATDEECFPMIPDNPELIRAIRSYIKYQWFDILNDMDKISDRKLNKAETDYAWNIGQAQSNMQMPSIDEMETLTNMVTQILPSRTAHSSRFQFLGEQELMKIQ